MTVRSGFDAADLGCTMRKAAQEEAVRVLCPVPRPAMAEAAALWWRHFGGMGAVGACRADRGIAALDAMGRVLGVVGLRDAAGGFAPEGGGLARHLFRPAPPTPDLVIDGIAVTVPRRGVGRLLLAGAVRQARLRGHPGLRVEVRASNAAARAFYDATGFAEEGRGRYGLPWWGPVVILRRAVPAGAA